jgi:hypothetical protein
VDSKALRRLWVVPPHTVPAVELVHAIIGCSVVTTFRREVS